MIQPDINILGLHIHLYSVLVGLGILVGYLVARKRVIRKGLKIDLFDNLILIGLIFGTLGARLFFVAGQWQYFASRKIEILYFWQGGLAFYGAIAGALAGLGIYYFYNRFKLKVFADSAALGLALGQGIGRWGNFFNNEAYGKPTDLPWGIYIAPEYRVSGFENQNFFHPTFFYESLILFALFLVMMKLDRRESLRSGILFGLYATVSGAARFLIEFLRLDALLVGPVMISQAAAGLMFLTGVIILLKFNAQSAKQTV